MQVLLLQVPLEVANPLDNKLLNGLHLGLVGDHQYLNAGLAIKLCSTWLQSTGHIEPDSMDQNVRSIKYIVMST